jgi:hypothetical protein
MFDNFVVWTRPKILSNYSSHCDVICTTCFHLFWYKREEKRAWLPGNLQWILEIVCYSIFNHECKFTRDAIYFIYVAFPTLVSEKMGTIFNTAIISYLKSLQLPASFGSQENLKTTSPCHLKLFFIYFKAGLQK